MGYPGKSRKSYTTPRHPWQAERITSEAEIVKSYGLRNKRELWKVHSQLRKYRQMSRMLLAEGAKGTVDVHTQLETENILNKLKSLGILKEDAGLDDILALEVGSFLERRLQTQVYRLGLANSIKQARQFIVHGHIAVNGRKVTVPGYLVPLSEEATINYYEGSPLASESHPERPAQVISAQIKSEDAVQGIEDENKEE